VFKELPPHADTNRELVDQVLEEGGKFASQVLFPLNHSGDREGCHFDRETKSVTTPKGFKEAYKQYEAGWAALSCDPDFGGQGLPLTINNSFYEMLNSPTRPGPCTPACRTAPTSACTRTARTNRSSSTCPSWSGEWTGTMCLTEPHCGTDLGLAHQGRAAGRWLLQDHRQQDLHLRRRARWSENIVHLVLARLPDAPKAPRASRCSWCPSSCPMPTARWASATRSSAVPSKTRWASTATPPAR
jgi:alkylation response protein AidB-like acyl-CoA dehydrogenase